MQVNINKQVIILPHIRIFLLTSPQPNTASRVGLSVSELYSEIQKKRLNQISQIPTLKQSCVYFICAGSRNSLPQY